MANVQHDGFPVMAEMTDREILEEMATNMRSVAVALEALADNPMIAAIANGQNPMLAMMGR